MPGYKEMHVNWYGFVHIFLNLGFGFITNLIKCVYFSCKKIPLFGTPSASLIYETVRFLLLHGFGVGYTAYGKSSVSFLY